MFATCDFDKRLLKALPNISFTIQDDSRHEKILSYLVSRITDPQYLKALVHELNCLDNLNVKAFGSF